MAHAMRVSARPVFFRKCDVNKPEGSELRHAGPCIQWDRVGIVALVLLFGAGLATWAYAAF
ncbi:hypothetical protein G5B46_21470 [Caulobacter sp. 602-2]|uniref:Uncharacterized protein n=1 Tax=Caulobacter sp. 602-2 TaxID=2710887 RepID=A0A6G4R2N9_9CAUL|nr:hypothetical protein [Caulobacter sp. 602-2]NGM52186.1 hypothetical protein [Caulobacter sp. 602-2]